jgi:uncharacterized protein
MRQSTSDRASEGSGAAAPAVPVSGGWSTPEPAWKEAASASDRWPLMIGAGLGVLGCLALGAALFRSLWGPESMCADGAACNAAGASYAQAPTASESELALATRLFQRGCELGHAPACNNLGLAHESGSGVPQDYERAMLAFERACSGGFAEGCSNQGTLHEHGLGVPVNLGDAQRAYNLACRRGSALGCSNLGVLYAEGKGVTADEAMASRLFAEACQGGSDVGCENLFEIEHQASGRRFR